MQASGTRASKVAKKNKVGAEVIAWSRRARNLDENAQRDCQNRKDNENIAETELASRPTCRRIRVIVGHP